MNHKPDLWKSIVDADVTRRTQRTTRVTEKGLKYRRTAEGETK